MFSASFVRFSAFKKASVFLGALLFGLSVSSCSERHTIPLQEGGYALGASGVYLNGESSERHDLFDSISLQLSSISQEAYSQKNGIGCVEDLSKGNSCYSLDLRLQIKGEQSKTVETTLSPHTNVVNESYEFNCHDSYIAGKESFDFAFSFTPSNDRKNECRASFGYSGSDSEVFSFSAVLNKV